MLHEIFFANAVYSRLGVVFNERLKHIEAARLATGLPFTIG